MLNFKEKYVKIFAFAQFQFKSSMNRHSGSPTLLKIENTPPHNCSGFLKKIHPRAFIRHSNILNF